MKRNNNDQVSGGDVFTGYGLSVCPCVCLQHNKKSYRRILMKCFRIGPKWANEELTTF